MSLRVVTLTVMVVLAGCGPGRPAAGPTAPPTGAPASAEPPALLAAWQAKGATEVPPDSTRRASLDGIEVVNQTHGAVADADARAWAADLMRTSGYDDWALNHMQDGFYVRGGLSGAPQTVFRYELNRIQAARAGGDRIEATAQKVRRLVLRAVPDSLRPLYDGQLMLWSAYSFYVDKIGPADLTFVGPSGLRTPRDHVGEGVALPELIGGMVVHDAVLGDIWRMDSDFDCSATSDRLKLGALCEP